MLPEPLNTIKKRPILSLYVAGVILLLLTAWLWFFKLSVTPERTFWATLGQSMATRSVTIEAEQKGNGASLRQTLQYSLGATNIAHSLTRVEQGETTVVNELVGTPDADYTRYVSVQTDQKGADGKPLDFSKVIGVWAKNEQGQAQLFSQAVLGVGLPLGGVAIPIGNLQPGDRAEMLAQLRDDNVYKTDFKKAKAQHKDGRLHYVYDVEVQPVAYANLMQRFARNLGLHDLDDLDPSQFKGQPATKMRLTIDARARHLVAAEVTERGARQTYSSYDIPSTFTLPKKTITIEELQSRLTNL